MCIILVHTQYPHVHDVVSLQLPGRSGHLFSRRRQVTNNAVDIFLQEPPLQGWERWKKCLKVRRWDRVAGFG
jgi:hypothetical protein